MMNHRCAWVTDDPLYITYHDHEWGKPVHEDRKLFEMLSLEGAQAGLSWITILKRRENYRAAFDNFDHEIVSNYYEDRKVFDMIALEGDEARLSWITILKRREYYRAAFDNLDPEIVSNYNEDKIQALLLDEWIILNKLKVRSVVTNAQAFLKVQLE